MRKFISAFLATSILLTNLAILFSLPVAAATTVLMRENFETATWYQNNTSFVSVSDTLAGGTTSTAVPTKIISFKAANSTGSIVFKITSSTPLIKLLLNWSGRAISNNPNVPGKIDFLISKDNTTYESAKRYVGTTTGLETNFYNRTVTENISQYVRGLTEFYIKIDMASAGMGEWTAIDFIEFVSDDTATEHTVTFNSNGGTAFDPIIIDSGNSIVNLPSPYKSGFAFVGWFTDENFTTQFTGKNITSSSTVYAKWLEKTVQQNGIILNEGFDEFNTFAKNVNLTTNTNIKDGVSSSGYKGVIPTAATPGVLIFEFNLASSFKKLYMEYSGKINGVGATTSKIDFYVSTDKTNYTKIVTEESKNGSTNSFLGDKAKVFVFPDNLNNSTNFYIKVELTGSNDLTFLDNIKLVTFEQLATEKTVAFDSDGGQDIAAVTTNIGTVNLPTPPTKAGYQFKGWYLENGNFFNGSNVTDNITVTAKWANEKPVLKGDVNQDGDINVNDTLTLLSDITGKIKLKIGTREIADVNSDNSINVNDALLSLSHIIGKSIINEVLADGEFYYTDKFVQSKTGTVLNGYFNDNMLLQQNQPINVFGTESTATEVKATLIRDKDRKIIASNTAQVVNKEFKIVLSPVKGSFDSYTLVVEGSGKIKYSNVLIGELWLASGQSNMELAVKMMYNASDVLTTIDNSNLRFFHEINRGDNGAEFPSTPISTTPSTIQWNTGCIKATTAEMSAIGYSFAKDMYKNLNVPIGVIDVAVGGSKIEPWLSRNAIDANSFISTKLKNSNAYLTQTEINSSKVTTGERYNQMTVQYNKRIAPLKGVNLKGVMWYQGEGNNGDIQNDYYAKALDVLIKEWSPLFGGSADNQLPFIFIDIAPYTYGSESIPLFNEQLYKTWTMNKAKNAPIYIGDLPLYYTLPTSPSVVHPIHPIVKQPIGERCAIAAMKLAYGADGEYMSPAFESATIVGNKIQVKFSNVGDGLKIKDGDPELVGFTIAGSDGKFIRANAKIISKDTVEVYSSHISSPKTVAYAFTNFAMYSNLVNSINLPALSFRSVTTGTFNYYSSKEWSYIASPQVWIFGANAYYTNPWIKNVNSTNKLTSITADLGNTIKDKFAVKAEYNNTASPISFGVSTEALNVENGSKQQYNSYTKLSFTVHNNNDRAITFDKIQAVSSANNYFAGTQTTIAANSSLEITVDLNTFKNASGTSASAYSVLTNLSGLYFEFTDNSQGQLFVSGIEFWS